MGPSIGPTRAGMATKLIARTSSDLAKVRTRVSRPTGTIIAPPQPCSTRQATSRVDVARQPAQERAQGEQAMAEANTRRVPNRSAIQPLIGMNTARLRV